MPMFGKLNMSRIVGMASCGVLAAVILTVFVPQTAFAAGIVDLLNSWMFDLFKDISEWFLNSSIDAANLFGMDDALTASFGNMLNWSGNGNDSAYNVAKGIQQVIVALGHSILALVMLIQVVKISQRIDATATLPAVKDIVFLAVFFVIFTWLINNSFEICSAVYEEVRKIIVSVLGENSSGTVPRMELGENTGVTLGGMLGMVVVSLLMWVISILASVVACAVSMARAIQLYVMAACSPLPLAFLGFEETRQIGIGFCKNFISVCLSGLIIATLVLLYPGLVGDIMASFSLSIDNTGAYLIDAGSFLLSLIPFLACSVMYLFALLKSGAWARDILGG